jgi:hypothetical protein
MVGARAHHAYFFQNSQVSSVADAVAGMAKLPPLGTF